MRLSVDGELRVGGSAAHATANADLSDGSKLDVTKTSEWQSSNEVVALVQMGVIEPRGIGEAEISITYAGMRASVVVRVGARVFDATGRVVNTFSDEAVVAAVVVIENGPDAGRTARTGSDGAFTLVGLTSLDAVIHVDAEGYERERDSLAAHNPIVFRMEPLLTTSRWAGTFLAFDHWVGWPGDVSFTIHHAGPVDLTFTAGCVTFGTYGEAGITIRRLPDLSVRLQLESDGYSGSPTPGGTFVYERSDVLPSGDYQLSAASGGVGWTGCPWTIRLSRPE